MRDWTFRLVDLETTGFQDDAEVIEMATQEVLYSEERQAVTSLGRGGSWLFGAERGIPPEAMAVHHIWPEDIAGKPTFAEAGTAAWAARPPIGRGSLFPSAEIDANVAHNAEHERKHLHWLTGLTPWICTYKCGLQAYPEAPSHKNFVLAYWLMREKGLVNPRGKIFAHRAAGDLWATRLILTQLLLDHGVNQLLTWTFEAEACLKVPVGEHRGKRWHEIDLGLLEWFLKPGKDFKPSVLKAAKAELDRRVQERVDRDRSPGPLFNA